MTDWKTLFVEHISIRQMTVEKVLNACSLDSLVIGAGGLTYYTEDDSAQIFRPYHHFTHWCPAWGQDHMLHIRPGQKPKLYYFMPDDFWHEHKPLAPDYWTDAFDIEVCGKVEDIWQNLGRPNNAAYIGTDRKRAGEAELLLDVDTLMARLNWERSYKSAYEVACLSEANKLAAIGHKAVRDAFIAGGKSELDLHHLYLSSMRRCEDDMPYTTIICLDEKSAVLHYHHKRDDIRGGKVFLIDAGARWNGYIADVTRSYVKKDAHPVFASLLADLKNLQRDLYKAVRPGITVEELHGMTMYGVADALIERGILRNCDRDQAVEREFARAFFPHGVGHMLGIFTHDVAGRQQDAKGTPSPPSEKYKTLRTNRSLEAGHVFTVEPGIYFIDMLLKPFRAGEHSQCFDWKLIDALMPMGGLRVEDDVLVTATGLRNLTREHLPD